MVELTEGLSLEGVFGLRDIVERLRDPGFRVAVDDLARRICVAVELRLLGAGHRETRLSLIRSIERHPTKRKLVGYMAALCRDLGILVVAEDIETDAERDVVVDMGCDLLQGFLIGPPGRRP